MSDFKVGEILIFQNGTSEASRNGSECELLGGLELRQIGIVDHASKRIITKDEMTYRIQFQDGNIFNCFANQLRRKKPPTESDSNTIVSWDDCGWNPNKIKELI